MSQIKISDVLKYSGIQIQNKCIMIISKVQRTCLNC